MGANARIADDIARRESGREGRSPWI